MASFDYFVIFAEMRTGSNLLEANLNQFPGLTCHGEAFNPHFIGYPNKTEILGKTQHMRDADPWSLVEHIRDETEGLGGFRFFHDHDARILTPLLDDRGCAKIILTRNPLDSYVSWKIAQETGQWKLTNVAKRKEARATFDVQEFETHVSALQAFQVTLLQGLQRRGQTAFYVSYDDIQDLDVINGLARWLGTDTQLGSFEHNLKPQNPSPVIDKVANVEDMQAALARMDWFNLSHTPNFEPRRGPAVPGYMAAPQTPLMYLPIKGGPETTVQTWLGALDGADADAVRTAFNQKELRQWLRSQEGHRRFTVLRHPLVRAHHVFCTKILPKGPGTFGRIRRVLQNRHNLPIPENWPDTSYNRDTHKIAFVGFLEFIRLNLNGQTNLRIDPHWCSQVAALQGMAELVLPDLVLREDDMAVYLPALAQQLGHDAPPEVSDAESDGPFGLSEIYDVELEMACRAAYARDYLMLGFSDCF